MLQMMMGYLNPIEADEQALGLETIAEVEPGGHFFGTQHTLDRCENAFYTPLVSDWSNYEIREEEGARTTAERANTIWKQLLREYEQTALDPAIDEALEDYLMRRKRGPKPPQSNVQAKKNPEGMAAPGVPYSGQPTQTLFI
jgi:trimethylamine--corrinoid protein Co-methyltransferase